MSPAPSGDPFSLGEKILALLEEGSFTATYKYAVLLAVVDLCMEGAAASGAAPRAIGTRELARKIVEIYWPHTRDFATTRTTKFLRQNSGGQAEILTAIRRFREQHATDPLEPLSRARSRSPSAFDRLIEFVEFKLVEMPLPRLQRFGKSEDRFLYDFRWNPVVRRSDLDDPAIHFDRRIHLREGVGDSLVQLAGLLRPLVQRHWASMVAGLNRDVLQAAELEEFLFGKTRIDLTPVCQPLRELQENRCFYCGERIRGAAEVDHFIPWSRHPDDGIANLVIADPGCNSDKRDFFASLDHLSRWNDERFVGRRLAPALAEIATVTSWEHEPERTRNVARSLYRRLPARLELWRRRGNFVLLDRSELDGIFPPGEAARIRPVVPGSGHRS